MSVAIISQPSLITPSYSDHTVNIYDSARSAATDLYYELDVVVGSETRTIKQLPDLTKHAIVEISKILQSFLQSAIFVHSDLNQDVTNGFITYVINVRSISAGTTTNATSGNLFCFNGLVQPFETWNYLNYFPKTGSVVKFLNSWTTKREVHSGDNIYLQTFVGTWGAQTSNFSDITVTIYNYGGSTITQNVTLYRPSSSPGIISINVGPSILTASNALLVFTNCEYYEVKEKNNLTLPVKIYLTAVDTRFDKYFRIGYTGNLGSTELINFDLANENIVNISKSLYSNNDITKVYNTEIEDNYSILSNYMSEAQSLDLKPLWSSPVTAEVIGTVVKPVIMNTSSVRILKRKNEKTINYGLSFRYANRYTSYRQ